MKFFVRNLAMKFVLLGLLATPLALYALSEVRRLSQSGGGDAKEPTPYGTLVTDITNLQDQAKSYVAIPYDLRKEMVYPNGGAVADVGDPYKSLAESVKERANVLADWQAFLPLFASIASKEIKVPKFAGANPRTTAMFDKAIKNESSRIEKRKLILADSEELDKATSTEFVALEKRLTLNLRDYEANWPTDEAVTKIRGHVQKKQIEFTRRELLKKCTTEGENYVKLIRSPTVSGLTTFRSKVDDLVEEIRMLNKALDPKEALDDQLKLWEKRRTLLPKIVELLDGTDKKPDEFIAACKALTANENDDAEIKRAVRGILDGYCKSVLNKELSTKPKFDSTIILFGSDKAPHEVPRKDVRIFYNNNDREYLKDPNPTSSAGSEFDIVVRQRSLSEEDRKRIGVKYIIAYDSKTKDELPNLRQIELDKLQPTRNSAAAHFYYKDFLSVESWDAGKIQEYFKKCEEHKNELPELFQRLATLAKAKDLFPNNNTP